MHIYLKMDRPELAEKVQATLAAGDDEAAVTQLSGASLLLALGGDKAKEAVEVYKDLLSRNGPTPSITNGLCAAYIVGRRWEDAAKVVAEALEKNGDDEDALINAACVAAAMGRHAEAAKHVQALRTLAPTHPYIASLDGAQHTFDRIAATLAPV